MKVFVTGGAGYIGSHVVKALGESGHDILILDNLSTGHNWAVLYGTLTAGDLEDSLGLGIEIQAMEKTSVVTAIMRGLNNR